MEILKTENLSKTYGAGETRVEALKGVSFSVSKGEFVSIVGPSVDRYNQTLIMITHNQNYASYANRVFNVEDGVLTELGGGGR